MNLFVHPLVGFIALVLAAAAYQVDSGRETRGAAHRILGTLSVILAGVAFWLGMRSSLGAAAPPALAVHRLLGILTFGLLVVVGVLGVASEGGRKAIGKIHGKVSAAVLILGFLLLSFGLAGLGAIVH